MKTTICTCLLLSFSLLYIACQSNDLPIKSAKLGKIIELKIGEQAHIASTDVQIQIDAILEDSRCPNQTNCIYSGQVKSKLQFNKKSAKYNLTLNASLDSPQEAQQTVDGYTVRMISVSPYPEKNQEIKPEEYIISIVVE